MSERGASLGPIKTLEAASWLKVCERLIRGRRSSGPAVVRPPNTRVQRTRAARSPLTRHPLGSPKCQWVSITAGVLVAIVGCASNKSVQALKGPAKMTCEPAETSSVAVLSVEAYGPSDVALPGATVSVSGDIRGGHGPIRWFTTVDKPLRQALAPGSWQVEVSLEGFENQGGAVSLEPGQACILTFNMDWDRSKWVAVQ